MKQRLSHPMGLADTGSMYEELGLNPDPLIRERLNQLIDTVPAVIQERWRDATASDKPGRFFQAHAEASTAAFLAAAGWKIVDLCSPHPCLVAQHKDGREIRLIVLAFIQSQNQDGLDDIIGALQRAAERTDTNVRIAVTIDKFDPAHFDPVAVGRAMDLWVQQLNKGTWTSRYASYEDEHTSMEFSLTDEQASSGRRKLAFVLGPQQGSRTMEIIESRLIYELDNRLRTATGDGTALVCLATNTDWGISPGHIRTMLYGRPTWQIADGTPFNRAYGFEGKDGSALFSEEHYRRICGVMMLDQNPTSGPCGRAYLNPWADGSFGPSDLGCASLAMSRTEGDLRVMRWSHS